MADQTRTATPDWGDLKFLIELARQGSLSATARSLGVTHATVGRRIASLESASGRPLFRRENGRYVLTRTGAHVAALARDMEEPALAITRALAGGAPSLSGPVRVTAADPVAAAFAIPAIAEMQGLHGCLDIEVIVTNENLSLARRDADIALRGGRPTAGDLVARKLGDLSYFTYASAKYLAQTPEKQRRYIGYCRTPTDFPEVQAIERMSDDNAIMFRTNTMNVRVAAVASGLGIALLPKVVAESVPGLVKVDSEPALTRELWLIVHRDLRDVPRIRECVDLFVKAAARHRRRLT